MNENFSREKIYFDIDTVLWNRLIPTKANHVKNFVCLLVKQYIYRQRCLGKNLSTIELRKHVLHVKNMEKYIATKNHKLSKHQKKWYGKPQCEITLEQPNSFAMEYINNIELHLPLLLHLPKTRTKM